MSRIVEIDPAHPETDKLAEARMVLEAGGLVIVPTETVYGIACNPTVPGAMEKLIAAKGRDGAKPIARLAADTAHVADNAKHWNTGLQALAAEYWPGPLTIVLETHDSWTGYRIPNHAVPLELAKACGCTLALTSANLSGHPDTKTAQEAMVSVDADLVLDCGPSAKTAIPSTVVKVDGECIECLREGCLPFNKVEKVFTDGLGLKTVLFVCTGNICRSPMAAALFRHRVGENSGWISKSAGVFAGSGNPASDNAILAMRELDIDITKHRSRPLSMEVVHNADLIVTMAAEHRFHILDAYPEVEDRVYLIKSFGTSKIPRDVSDPFGGSLNTYKRIRDEIDRSISDLVIFIRTGK